MRLKLCVRAGCQLQGSGTRSGVADFLERTEGCGGENLRREEVKHRPDCALSASVLFVWREGVVAYVRPSYFAAEFR